MGPLLNKIASKTKKFVLPLFFIIVAIWTLPRPLSFPHVGLDPSWLIGINMAFLENLQFGKDIVFPFGPLGFLWVPYLINYNLWTLSLFFCLFTHFLFIGSIFLLLKKLSARWYHYIVLISILIFAIPPIEYKLGIIVLIFLYVLILSTESRGKDLVGLVFMGSLLSIATLIKFNAFFMSISIILMTFPVCMLAKKNVKYGAYLMISYFIFLISMWLVSGQNIANFIRYLHNGIELSRGYTDAMALMAFPGQNWQVFVGLISILSVLVLFMYYVRENKRNILLFLLLNLGILFVAFKHGFVRHDTHVMFFFQVYLLFFGLLLIITLQEIKIREFDYRNPADIFLNIFMIIILFFSMCYVAPSILNDNIMTKSASYSLAGDILTNPTSFRENVESQKERMRKEYPLDPQTIKYIDEKTMDIFPWDIALCWAYDFNWSPRPVFQSYSAYTQHLDKINSQHFMENSSPQAILYAYKSIDGRYPLFDEPTTFHTILCDYTYLNKSGEFLLLTHNPKAKNCGFEGNFATINSEIGQLVSIPEYNEGYVFGHIELEYSFIGKIMKIIYKPSPVYIQFKFKDGTYSQNFRLIPDTAKNGIFLSQYVGNLDDLTSIFQGQIINDIDGIVIETDNPAHYSKHVKVKFVGVPANVSVKSRYLSLAFQTISLTGITNKSFMTLSDNWYDLEDWKDIPTRWSSNNATISISSTKSRHYNLSFNVVSFYRSRNLKIYLNDGLIHAQKIPTSFVVVEIPVKLKEGDNRIRFYTQDGCQRPVDIPDLKNEDSRYLSLAFQTITLTEITNKSLMTLSDNWYDREELKDIATRWSSNNATINIYSTESMHYNLSFSVVSFYQPRNLKIYLNDGLIHAQKIPTSFVVVEIPVKLKEGDNRIRFYTPDGCQRPVDIPELKNGDSRCLCLAFQNITLLHLLYESAGDKPIVR